MRYQTQFSVDNNGYTIDDYSSGNDSHNDTNDTDNDSKSDANKELIKGRM